MPNKMYDKGREELLGPLNWLTADIRAILAKATYNFNSYSLYVTDLGNVINGRTGSFYSKTNYSGVADAGDMYVTASSGVQCGSIVIYNHTGDDATSPLLVYIDGKIEVIMAADIGSGATSIWMEPTLGGALSGSVLTKVSGTGPATITTTADFVESARKVNVVAIGSIIVAGAVYIVNLVGSGLPFTPMAGQQIFIPWSNGPNKIFRI